MILTTLFGGFCIVVIEHDGLHVDDIGYDVTCLKDWLAVVSGYLIFCRLRRDMNVSKGDRKNSLVSGCQGEETK